MIKLSILIPTVPTRRSLLSRLLYTIERQLTPEVEVLIYDGLKPMGDKYTEMIKRATGEYVVMVDDDDLLTDDYLSLVIGKLNIIDYLGYRLLTLKDGKYWLTITHSYEYKDYPWTIEGDRSYRGVSNKCPIRREIANKFVFNNEYSSDVTFIKAVEGSGLIKQYGFIDRCMYVYDFRTHGTIGTSNNDTAYQQNYNSQADVGNYPYSKDKFIWI